MRWIRRSIKVKLSKYGDARMFKYHPRGFEVATSYDRTGSKEESQPNR